MADGIVRVLISLSVQATVAGLLVLTLRWVLGRRLPVKIRYFLWAVVLVKLLLPINISSTVSVFNVFNHFQPAASVVNNTTGVRFIHPEASDTYRLTAQPNTAYSAANLTPPVERTTTGQQPTVATGVGVSVIVLAVMITIAAVLLLRSLWKYLNLKIQIYKWRREGIDTERHEKIREYLVEAGITERHNVDIVFTHAAQTPYTFGFFNPIIVTPAALADGDETTFRAVVYHEGTHIRLNHHRVKFLTMLLQCVFWFNPFVHLFNLALSADMETDCDDRVLRLMDTADYVNALINIASIRRVRFAPVAAFTANGLKHRVKRILEGNKMTKFFMGLSAVLAAALCVVLLTGAHPAARDTVTTIPDAPGVPNIVNVTEIPSESKDAFTFSEALTGEIGEPADASLNLGWVNDLLNNIDWSDADVQINNNSFDVMSDYFDAIEPEADWPTIKTSAIDMTAVTQVTIDASSTYVRVEKSTDNTSYAVLACEEHIDFTLDTALSPDGTKLTYTASMKIPQTSGNVSTPRHVITIYLPEKTYSQLEVIAGASSAKIHNIYADTLLLKGGAGSLSLTDSVVGWLNVDISASSLDISGTRCNKLTGSTNAAGLKADFNAFDFDMDLTVSASSIAISFGQPVADAAFALNLSSGTLDCPDAWKNAPGTQWEEIFSVSSLSGNIGEGSHTLKINASASGVTLKESH